MGFLVVFAVGVTAGWLGHKYWSGIKEVFSPRKEA